METAYIRYVKKYTTIIKLPWVCVGGYFLGLLMAVLGAWTAEGASTVVSTSFRETTAPGWIFSGTGTNNLGGDEHRPAHGGYRC